MTDSLPSGTVTLLFTDIEGSSRLWDDHRSEMAAASRDIFDGGGARRVAAAVADLVDATQGERQHGVEARR